MKDKDYKDNFGNPLIPKKLYEERSGADIQYFIVGNRSSNVKDI